MAFKVPEKYRVIYNTIHPYYSDKSFGNNGHFEIPIIKKVRMKVIASDGGGWDHVSVSLKTRIANYYEMKKIRRLFWGDDDIVVEYHMGETNHVNIHKHVLHLWRCQVGKFPTPPRIFV